MAWVKKMVYELVAFYKDCDELPISEEELYDTLEEAEAAKDRWLEDDNIESVIINDEPVEKEILM